MKKNNRNFLIALVIILALGGFLFISRDTSTEKNVEKENIQAESIAPTSKTKTYTNNKYGFSFEYLAEYSVIEYSPSQISVGETTTQGFEPIANFSVFESDPDSAQSFEEFVLDQARLSCSSEELTCLEITDLRPFFATSEVEGQKFSLIAYRQNDIEGVTFGPYYTFNMSGNTPGEMSFLMVSSANNMRLSDVKNTNIIETMSLSLDI